jgi:endonuclease/exonuclease/phosphatase family metal-dependent hydrolase
MRLRFLTWNIHKGIGGLDRRYRPDRIVAVLAAAAPDIAFLQEVDDGVPRSHRHRQVDWLGDALGLPHRAFQANVKLTEGAYGNAILSRFPLSGVEHLDLTLPLKKRRRALIAHARVPLLRQHSRSLLLANFHLGLSGLERRVQLKRILAHHAVARAHHDTPAILAGDMNDVWGFLGEWLLEPAGFKPAAAGQATFPAALPMRALDTIHYRGDLVPHGAAPIRNAATRAASDHLPLAAEFELRR